MRRHVALLVVMLLLSGCQSLFFWPSKTMQAPHEEFGFVPESVKFPNEQGLMLHGWFVPARATKAGTQIPPHGTVYVLHGNALNLSYHIVNFYWLIDHGWNVFILDYQGFGQSQGSPSFAGIIEDALAGYRWLQQYKPDDGPVVVLGQSLGGAAAIGLVAQASQPPAGLIVDSTFSSHRQIFQETLDKSWLLRLFQWPLSIAISDDYAPKMLISQGTPVPTLIVHSLSDTLISPKHAHTLYDHAAGPKMLWVDANSSHGQIWSNDEWKARLVCQLGRWPQLQSADRVCDSPL